MASIVLLFIFFSSLFLQIDQSKEIKSCEEVKDCEACANGTIDINGVKCEWCSTTRRCSGYVLNTCPLEDRIPQSYNCPSSVNWVIYNENFTREIVLPLIGAVNAKPRKHLNRLLSACFRKARLINHYEVSCDVRTNLSNCYAYMVYFPSHGALALTFRGTSNVFQLIDEIISMSLYEKIPYEPTGGVVDHYYHDAFYKLWDSGMKQDFEKELQCFGHSLGGGLASLAATHISYTYDKRENIRLTTFGQPRIGNIAFAAGHDKLVPYSVRIVHRLDPIPALPPRGFDVADSDLSGAFHHRLEVWYPFGMAPGSFYQIGINADTFFTFVSMDNWRDHLTYFEIQLDKFPQIGCAKKGVGVNQLPF